MHLIMTFFYLLISRAFDKSRKKINTHIQWHFCQGVSNTIFEQGSRKIQLHRDLLIQLSQASNSLKIRKPRSPLSTTDGHQIFHKQLKKPGRQAKALFKNPAGTTHRHPAANTSFNRTTPNIQHTEQTLLIHQQSMLKRRFHLQGLLSSLPVVCREEHPVLEAFSH